MISTAITAFRGRHTFLSNFSEAKVYLTPSPNASPRLQRSIADNTYPTVEHAYQAAKTINTLERAAIKKAPTPGEAKRLGQSVTLRRDWDEVKVSIMKDLLRQKFLHPELRAKLIATQDAELIEGNTWGDRYWGTCAGVGKNMLGKLLIEIRAELTRST